MSKFKIGKHKEKLSDQEIEQQMNFDKFISGHTPVKSWMPKGKGFNISSLIVTTATVLMAVGYLVYRSNTKEVTSLQPFINPPVQAMDLPSDTFAFDNVKDTTIVFNTGTLIHVSPESFVDEDGKDIKGPVQIRYREFHDPIDIMLSGIPMSYDSAGMHYQLESAGMFQVMAYQDGQAIYLKPGKELSVDMISHTGNSSDYNIYYLDTVKRKWDYVSENTGKNKTCIPIFDRNPDYEKQLRDNDLFEELNKPVLPKMENSKAYNFVIDFKRNEFPELAVYSGLKFEPVEGKKKDHTELAEKVWEDVLIERAGDNEHYTVTFSSEKESHSIKVIPVVDRKNYAATLKDFKNRQQLYETSLAERKKNAKDQRDSLYRIRSAFSGAALRSNLNERFNNFIDGNFMETSKDLLAYRTFAVSRLGVWNSDKPIGFFDLATNGKRKTGEHIAEFVSRDNQPLVLKNVYLVRRHINSLYSVSEVGFAHFPFGKEIDVIVGIGYNNELFYIKDEELKEVDPDQKTVHFKMQTAAGIVSVAEFKKLLKI